MDRPSLAAGSLLFVVLTGCGGDAHAPRDATLDGPTADGPASDGFGAADTEPPDAAWADTDGASSGRPDAMAPVVIDDTGVPEGAALYTVGGTEYGIREIGRALDAVATESGVDNVILYVHGRGCGDGGEPRKSLEGAMPALARDYSAVPILLLWPGSDDGCPLGFPSDRALAAGPALAVVLGDLHRWQQAHPDRREALGWTLLTHSLGSFVLQSAAAVSGVDALPPSLFDALVVNAAATPAREHASWLERVRFAAARYVTVNRGDNVLRLADLREPTPLGRDIDGVALAPGVGYVDFTANDVNHAYYLVDGQRGAAMRAFYQAVMNGRAFDFAAHAGVDAPSSRDGATLYRFNDG